MKLIRTLSLVAATACLSACSMSSYIPFMGNDKPVINLEQDKIDQKSYAIAYSTAVQSYSGKVNEDYDVNSFASGVNDWYRGRILVSLDQIRAKLASGIDSNVHAYYSGVVFAAELQGNFSHLGNNCWAQIDRPSMTQGIYDAMLDLKKGKTKPEDDEYLSKGNEQLLQVCQ